MVPSGCPAPGRAMSADVIEPAGGSPAPISRCNSRRVNAASAAQEFDQVP